MRHHDQGHHGRRRTDYYVRTSSSAPLTLSARRERFRAAWLTVTDEISFYEGGHAGASEADALGTLALNARLLAGAAEELRLAILAAQGRAD